MDCPFNPDKEHKTLIITVLCENTTLNDWVSRAFINCWAEPSLTCNVFTPALFRAAYCRLFIPHWGWFVWRGENIPIEPARQWALDSLGLRPTEPWCSSFEVRCHAGARQAAREMFNEASCKVSLSHHHHSTSPAWNYVVMMGPVCLWGDTFLGIQ